MRSQKKTPSIAQAKKMTNSQVYVVFHPFLFLFRIVGRADVARIGVGKGTVRAITELSLELGLNQFHHEGPVLSNVHGMNHKSGNVVAAKKKRMQNT
jgi:hypothetical protein